MRVRFKTTTSCALFATLFLFSTAHSPKTAEQSSIYHLQDAAGIVQQMITQAKSIRTLKYRQLKWERVEGNLYHEALLVKLNRSPFKVYIKTTTPREAEVLYVTGWNNGKAYVNAGSLIPNISLDINGGQLRENQHHNLLSSGFDVLVGIFEHLMSKYGRTTNMARLEGTETFAGRACHKVVLENPSFGFINYTVQAGENLLVIARKLKLGEHMILENNPAVDDYWDVTVGQVIKVPTDYSKKAVLWIDQTTYLPLKVMVYDHKGLYERYEYYDLVVNPALQPSEFTPDFPGYGY